MVNCWKFSTGWTAPSGTGSQHFEASELVFFKNLKTGEIKQIDFLAVGYGGEHSYSAVAAPNKIMIEVTGSTTCEVHANSTSFEITGNTSILSSTIVAWLDAKCGTKTTLGQKYTVGEVTSKDNRHFKLLSESDFKFRYVSLGDSIAAGHAINEDWETGTQYGQNGRKKTEIIPGTYTDIIRTTLESYYGKHYVMATSFARSGSRVKDTVDADKSLLDILDRTEVKEAIKCANLVTICIGANDVLVPAMEHFDDYIMRGQQAMNELGAIIDENITRLNNDAHEHSYMALFKKLHALNSTATFIFTDIYNPYKYLYLQPSTSANNYKDGFFGPLLCSIPDSVGSTLASSIRAGFVNAPAAKNIINLINDISPFAETYVTKLNNVLRNAIDRFNNYYFRVADTKRVFESVPDRPWTSTYHYNDLVNVEITRNYNLNDFDWGKFWKNTNWASALDDINNIASTIVNSVIEEVLVPDIDPHPEVYGHSVLCKALCNVSYVYALRTVSKIDRYTITYKSNTSTNQTVTQEVVGVNDQPAFTALNNVSFTHPTTGYYFTGWNDKADGTGNSYSAGQSILCSGDITLYAQWSNLYTVNFYKDLNEYAKTVYTGKGGITSNTGVQEIYGVQIYNTSSGAWETLNTSYYRGKFGNGKKLISSPMFAYGTRLKVWTTYTRGSSQNIPFVGTVYECNPTSSTIYLNGTAKMTADKPELEITISRNTDITFECKLSGTVYVDATNHWDCRINM